MPTIQDALMTTTGEYLQLARAYYKITHPKTVQRTFQKLRCMDFDPRGDRWVWLYEAEAKKLRFRKSYNQFDKNMRPIVLGEFRILADDQMIFDVRSLNRLAQGLDFFDRRINRRVANVTKMRIVNRLFARSENDKMNTSQSFHHLCNSFFEQDDIPPLRSEQLTTGIEALANQIDDKKEFFRALDIMMNNWAEKASPEVEELKPTFYEDGIQLFTTVLRFIEIEAVQQFQGKKFNLLQYISENSSWDESAAAGDQD